MKEYITMVVTVSVICGFVKALTSKGVLKGEISFAVGIIVLCVILSPLISRADKSLNSLDFFDINEENSHTIDNVDGDTVYRRWLAVTTSESLSSEIQKRIKEEMSIDTVVEVPWLERDGEIVFEKLIVTADCNEEKCKKIEEYISLHYSLSSSCKQGSVNDEK